MTLGMKRADLVQSLKYALNDAASAFTNTDDEDFRRHLDHAALDFGRVRRRPLSRTVTLVANLANYTVPSDVLRISHGDWGTAEQKRVQPWEEMYAGRLPRARLDGDPENLQLWLDPPPTWRQIELLGATYRYHYFAGHVIGDDAEDTSIRAEDRGLLLLRAQAEAMLELALRGSKKPVQLRDGLQSGPRNSTPSALYELMMEQFNMQAAW